MRSGSVSITILYRKEENKCLTRNVSKVDLTSYLRITATWFHAVENDRGEKSGHSLIVSVKCINFVLVVKKPLKFKQGIFMIHVSSCISTDNHRYIL
jgi:hypothetical protein